MLANAPCRFVGCLIGLLWITGCGQSASPTSTAETPDAGTTVAQNEPTPLPTAAIGANNAAPEMTAEAEPEPAEGTPEWLLREIQRTRLLPLPIVKDGGR